MAYKNMEILHLFLSYLEYNCDTKVEIRLCTTILENANHLNEIDSATLAKLSNTSIASITRLMKHFNVKDYKEFAYLITADYQRFTNAKNMNSNMIHTYGKEGFLEAERNNYTTNLQANSYTDKEVNELIDRILKAKRVTFIGAEHSLEIFGKLQLLLIHYKHPAFIFKQDQMLDEHLTHLDSNDLVIFISLHNRYQGDVGYLKLDALYQRKIPCVMISQYHYEDTSKYEQLLYFGKDHDWNHGYYSIQLLEKIIENKLLERMS